MLYLEHLKNKIIKLLKKILIFLCVLFISFGLSGCQDTERSGKSAYEIAVENGFKGSVAK